MRWLPAARVLLGATLAVVLAGCSGASEHAKAREAMDHLQISGVVVAEETQRESLVVSYLVDGLDELDVPGVAAEPEPPAAYLPGLLTPIASWNLEQPSCGVEAYEVTGDELRGQLLDTDTLEQVRVGDARLVQVYITCDPPSAQPYQPIF